MGGGVVNPLSFLGVSRLVILKRALADNDTLLHRSSLVSGLARASDVQETCAAQKTGCYLSTSDAFPAMRFRRPDGQISVATTHLMHCGLESYAKAIAGRYGA